MPLGRRRSEIKKNIKLLVSRKGNATQLLVNNIMLKSKKTSAMLRLIMSEKSSLQV